MIQQQDIAAATGSRDNGSVDDIPASGSVIVRPGQQQHHQPMLSNETSGTSFISYDDVNEARRLSNPNQTQVHNNVVVETTEK